MEGRRGAPGFGGAALGANENTQRRRGFEGRREAGNLAELLGDVCAVRTRRLSAFSWFILWIQHGAFHRGECVISASLESPQRCVKSRAFQRAQYKRTRSACSRCETRMCLSDTLSYRLFIVYTCCMKCIGQVSYKPAPTLSATSHVRSADRQITRLYASQ